MRRLRRREVTRCSCVCVGRAGSSVRLCSGGGGRHGRVAADAVRSGRVDGGGLEAAHGMAGVAGGGISEAGSSGRDEAGKVARSRGFHGQARGGGGSKVRVGCKARHRVGAALGRVMRMERVGDQSDGGIDRVRLDTDVSCYGCHVLLKACEVVGKS